MHRTTIMLPEDLKEQAYRKARDDGISLSALVREAVARYVVETPAERRDDPLFNLEIWEGPVPPDLIDRIDEELYGGCP